MAGTAQSLAKNTDIGEAQSLGHRQCQIGRHRKQTPLQRKQPLCESKVFRDLVTSREKLRTFRTWGNSVVWFALRNNSSGDKAKVYQKLNGRPPPRRHKHVSCVSVKSQLYQKHTEGSNMQTVALKEH